MKKIISIALSLIILTSTILVSSTDVFAKQVKNSYTVSIGASVCGELTYVKGKYIYSTTSGIYLKKSPTANMKKIVDTRLLGDLFATVISDGKKVYFIGASPENYYIYKSNLQGEYSDVCKTNICYMDNVYFITIYKNNAYYLNLTEEKIYQANLSSGKMKSINGKYNARSFAYHNGYIYFSGATGAAGEHKLLTTRKINLKNNKISKVLGKTIATDYCASDNKLALWSYSEKLKKTQYGSEYVPTKSYIYTIGTNNKKVKSKKLPEGARVLSVDAKGKFAIINKGNNSYYKFVLKTGKKYKLTKSKDYYNVTTDLKYSNSMYFIKNNYENDTIEVKALNGNKLKNCKIGGKNKIKSGGYFWISEKYLFVSYGGTKLKTFKIK